MTSHIQYSLFDDPSIVESPLSQIKNRIEASAESLVVVSYGGGKNSTAMLILCAKLEIKIDYILFADTGGETPQTYAFIDLFSVWLQNNSLPPITVVRSDYGQTSERRKTFAEAKKNYFFLLSKPRIAHCLSLAVVTNIIWWRAHSYATPTTLEEACLITQTLPSVAYGKKACSRQWKVEPQEDYLKGLGLHNKDRKIRKLIGYHAGEWTRAVNKATQKPMLEDDYYRYEYPLIQYGIDELGCRAIITAAGLPVPPKSSCFFCPNRTATEVENLPDDLRARGNLIEATNEQGIHYQPGTSVKGLGRNFRWQDLGRLTDLEKAISDQVNRQCTCIDF